MDFEEFARKASSLVAEVRSEIDRRQRDKEPAPTPAASHYEFIMMGEGHERKIILAGEDRESVGSIAIKWTDKGIKIDVARIDEAWTGPVKVTVE